jgi:hypothetical protein
MDVRSCGRRGYSALQRANVDLRETPAFLGRISAADLLELFMKEAQA